MALSTLFRLLSPSGRRARLSVMIFHRVLAVADPLFPYEIDGRGFDEVLSWVSDWFNVLPLDEAVERLVSGTLPERAASITFDDGYADNFTVALPLLQRHELTATFFIATGYIDGGCMWNDAVIEAVRRSVTDELNLECRGLGRHRVRSADEKALAIHTLINQIKHRPPSERIDLSFEIASSTGVAHPTGLMMTTNQIRMMRKCGMQIGAHTVTHPILARLPPKAARREIEESRGFLEDLLLEPVALFAYPNGKPSVDYTLEHAKIVRQLGFLAAVSTAPGAAAQGADVVQLPRFTPWDRTRLKFGARLAANVASARFLSYATATVE